MLWGEGKPREMNPLISECTISESGADPDETQPEKRAQAATVFNEHLLCTYCVPGPVWDTSIPANPYSASARPRMPTLQDHRG